MLSPHLPWVFSDPFSPSTYCIANTYTCVPSTSPCVASLSSQMVVVAVNHQAVSHPCGSTVSTHAYCFISSPWPLKLILSISILQRRRLCQRALDMSKFSQHEGIGHAITTIPCQEWRPSLTHDCHPWASSMLSTGSKSVVMSVQCLKKASGASASCCD